MTIDIFSVIDALNQEYGRRNTPGWLYLFGVIVSILGALSAKEFVRKNKTLKEAIATSLKAKTLNATIFSQDENQVVEYLGKLAQSADGYRLTIETRQNNEWLAVTDISLTSLDEISEYLRTNTKFILADFKS